MHEASPASNASPRRARTRSGLGGQLPESAASLWRISQRSKQSHGSFRRQKKQRRISRLKRKTPGRNERREREESKQMRPRQDRRKTKDGRKETPCPSFHILSNTFGRCLSIQRQAPPSLCGLVWRLRCSVSRLVRSFLYSLINTCQFSLKPQALAGSPGTSFARRAGPVRFFFVRLTSLGDPMVVK